ncbi:MAG: hypothetical protein WDW38_000727 [Sanguina aurantia]
MVYLAGNQTQRYPQEQKKTTNRFFHDEPSSVEPHKSSTFAKLYNNAPFFVTERNTLNRVSALNNTLQLFPSPPAMSRSGKLSASSHTSARTFQLHTGPVARQCRHAHSPAARVSGIGV